MADGSTTGTFFTSGTTLLFYQASAPTGWTQVTSHNDKALRVVSGTGGGSGGSTAFTSVFASRGVPLPDHNHGINDPGHTHNVLLNRGPLVNSGGADSFKDGGSSGSISTSTTGITIKNASETQTTGNTMDFAVQYIDIILCSKN